MAQVAGVFDDYRALLRVLGRSGTLRDATGQGVDDAVILGFVRRTGARRLQLTAAGADHLLEVEGPPPVSSAG